MANIGNLAVQLSLDSALFASGLDRSTKEGRAFASTITKTFAGIGTGIASLEGIGSGVSSLYGGLKSGLHEIVETGEEVHKLGTSFEGLAALQLLAGNDAERASKSFEHLSSKLAELKIKGGDAAGPLAGLKLKLSDLADKPFEQQLGLIAEKIQALGNASDRNFFAKEFLGLREGPAIIEKLARGTLDIKDAMAQIKSHGNILTNKDFEAALAAEKSIHEMESSFNRIKLSLISELSPVVKNFADGLADMTGKVDGKITFRGLADSAKDFLKGLVGGLIVVSDVMGKIVDNLKLATDGSSSGSNWLVPPAKGLEDKRPDWVQKFFWVPEHLFSGPLNDAVAGHIAGNGAGSAAGTHDALQKLLLSLDKAFTPDKKLHELMGPPFDFERFNKLSAEAKRIIEETQSPLDKFNDKFIKLKELLGEGLLTQGQFTTALAKDFSALEGKHSLIDHAPGALMQGSEAAHSMDVAFQRDGQYRNLEDEVKAGFKSMVEELKAQQRVTKRVGEIVQETFVGQNPFED